MERSARLEPLLLGEDRHAPLFLLRPNTDAAVCKMYQQLGVRQRGRN